MIEVIIRVFLFIWLFLLAVTLLLTKLYCWGRDFKLEQGHVYAMIFSFVSIIGFTGLANMLFKLELFI